MTKHKKTLAIDFGTKRIGLAVSYGSLAEPLEIVLNDENAFEKIKEICKNEDVEQVVIGISEGKTEEKTRLFADQLKKHVNLPIVFCDETLSSQTAEKKLKSRSVKSSKSTQPLDHYAAAEILQEYLDITDVV